MARLRLSMRWWLGLAFAAIAAVTAIAVAEMLTSHTEGVLDRRAEELATGSSFVAAREVTAALDGGDLEQTVAVVSAGRKLSLFVFDADARLITERTSRGIEFGRDGLHREALREALSGRRFVERTPDGKTIVAGLPLRSDSADALVTVARRSDLVAEAGLIEDEIARAALLAVLVGAVVGLLVAVLIAARLRRIASAAAAIEAGSFDAELRPGMRDEVGELAATIDRMRGRLRDSFGALAVERDRLRTLFDQLQEGVVAVDPELEVVLANGVARQLLSGAGLREGRLLPEPWPELSLRSLASGLFEPGAAVAQARISPDADHVYAVAGVPARGSRLALLVFADVTARERRERAEREFVANAAHELRTPITAIMSAVEALGAGAKDDPGDRERFLGVIDRQTRRLGRLVRALLVLARAQTREETLRLEPVEVRPLLGEVVETLDVKPGVTVDVECPDSLVVLAQRDLLAQVIGNLAANAARHTEQGRIVLAARVARAESVTIEVADTGPGIPPAARERIFDRFYSSVEEGRGGFGLGLSIAREAVRALGGAIEIEAAPGSGTVVRVTLAADRSMVAA